MSSPRARLLWLIGIVLVLLYALVPVVWMISLSLKPGDQLSDGSFLPQRVSLENYESIFSTTAFIKPLINSLGIAGIATAVAIGLASMAAYALSRLEFPG